MSSGLGKLRQSLFFYKLNDCVVFSCLSYDRANRTVLTAIQHIKFIYRFSGTKCSGFLDFLSDFVGNFSEIIGFPGELVPLTVVKMFSSSAATGLLLDVFKEYGTDSYIGLIASISMSCTETIFYTMSVYYMAAKVTKTRFTLGGALFSTFAGLIASVILAGMM